MMQRTVVVALAFTVASQLAQAQNTPLASKRFNYTNLPYQADTSDGERGRQNGYNRCNSTTAGPTSLCQTAIINAIDDFCLWAPQQPNSIVGDVEGNMVAWCTKPGYGTRLIPPGALTAVQFMKTPNYVQVTGYINQALVNIASDDDGGEMDPHGADQRGNPLGGLLFSQAFGGNETAVTNGTAFQQVIQWHNFMGANQFCLKACDPSYELGYRMCEHVYDRSGCNVNAPAAYVNNSFTSCRGDDQLPPGVYIGDNGSRSTWTQPGEGTALGQLPYSVFTPSSSECQTFQSDVVFAALASGAPVANATTTAVGPVTTSMNGTMTTSMVSASGATPTTAPRPSSTASGANNAAPTSTRPASPAGKNVAPIALGAFAVGMAAML